MPLCNFLHPFADTAVERRRCGCCCRSVASTRARANDAKMCDERARAYGARCSSAAEGIIVPIVYINGRYTVYINGRVSDPLGSAR